MRNPVTRTFFPVLALALGLMTAMAPAASADAGDSPVILYGGVGYLPNRAAPMVRDIFRAETPGNLRLARKIAASAMGAARTANIAWSELPTLIDRKDAEAAMHRLRHDWPGGAVDVQDLDEASDGVLELVVVADAHLHVPVPGADGPDGPGDEHFVAWATALLVVPGDGEIVLAASASHEIVHRFTRIAKAEHTRIFADAYGQAVASAIESLAGLSMRHSRTDAWDRIMVTKVILADKTATRRFAASTPPKSIGNVCAASEQCQGAACEQLFALTAQGVTRALTVGGGLTMPPLHWNGWGQTATDQLRIRFGLARGSLAQAETLEINVSPRDAGSFAVVVINALRTVDAPGRTNLLHHRGHVATIQIYKYLSETQAAETCAATLETRTPPTANSAPQLAVSRAVVTGSPPIGAPHHRALDLIAVQNASVALGCALKGVAPPCTQH